jgi:multidrug efflux pump
VLILQSVQDVRMGARGSSAQYQYTVQADHIEDLTKYAPLLLDKMTHLNMIADVTSDQQTHGLESLLKVDRDAAARMGVSMSAIDNTLNDAFGQRQVSNLYMPLNQYHVVLELNLDYLTNPDALKSIYVPASSGTMIPLSAFAHYENSYSALSVNHQGQVPSITISFNMAKGKALGDATDAIHAIEREVGLPPNVRASFQGTAQAFEDSLSTQPMLILTALATVYIVLGVLYESYIHPITILSTLPSAGVGALLAIQFFKTDLDVIALIGILLLIGIVKKNAILMIDFAIGVQRLEGMPALEAIHTACLLRFRPIMMTTLAALFGALPLALGTGTGSELRRPLGITIVGGLILSQALTLFTTPVVYLYMDRLQEWFARRRQPTGEAVQPAH